MSRFRKVDAGTWGDARFAALSQDAKLLWLYLLTGPEVTSLPGLIVAGRAHLSEVMGWDVPRFDTAFAELGAEDEEGTPMAKADWAKRVVWLPRSHKYNRPTNSNVIAGWADHWRVVPECSIKVEAYHTLRMVAESLGGHYSETFGRVFGDTPPKSSGELRSLVPHARRESPATAPALSEGVQGEAKSEVRLRAASRVEADEFALAPSPTPTAKSAKAPRAAKVATPIDPDWQVTEALAEHARVRKVDAFALRDGFVDHYVSKVDRHGKPLVSLDWAASFRTWIAKAIEFGNAPPYRAPPKPYDPRPMPGFEPESLPVASAAEIASVLATAARMAAGDMSDPDDDDFAAEERAS